MAQADTPGDVREGVPARWAPAGAAPGPWMSQALGAPGHAGATWRRHLESLARYRWLIVTVTLLGTAAGVGLTRIIRPKYRAEATMWIQATEPRGEPAGGPVGAGQLLNAYSWVDLLKSYTVLDDVVRELHLYVTEPEGQDSAPLDGFDVRPTFRPGSYHLDVAAAGRTYVLRDDQQGELERGTLGDSIGRALGFTWAPPTAAFTAGQSLAFTLRTPREVAREIAEDLDIRLDPGGTFLRLSLDGREPRRLAAVVNAIAQRYVTVAQQLKLEKVTGSSQVLADQLTSARQQLQTAEQALQRFEQTAVTQPGTAAGGDAEDPRVKSYLDLDVQLEQMRHDREAIESALRQAQDSAGALDALALIGPVEQVPDLKAALDELTSKRAELRSLRYRYTDKYPQVRRVAGEVDTLAQRTIPSLAGQLADQLRAREAQLQGWVASASRQMRRIPARTITEARLKRDMTIAENLYTTLQQRYDEARLAKASSAPDVRVLDAALPPRSPTENTAPRLVLVAFFGSLGVSVVGAVLLARLDRRVRGPEQVGLEMGLPLLGVIPHIRTRGKGLTPEQTAELVEALRGVRLNVLQAYGAPPPILFTVTSPGPGDGKSFVSSRLALAFADAGYRTVLVDADVRRGRLHHIFERPRRPGLIDHLQGRAGLPDIVQSTTFGPLDFIPCGARAPDGPELLGSAAMNDVLSQLRGRYEAVIVDSAPMAGAVDPFVLGAATGTLLIVVRTGYTDREVMAAKLTVLDRMPIRPLGVILNDVREASAYRLYSYYLPGYGPGDEGEGQGRALPAALSM